MKLQHHIWCNGFNPLNPNREVTQEALDNCPWCGSKSESGGLLKNYPMDGATEKDLMKKFFPNVKRIG